MLATASHTKFCGCRMPKIWSAFSPAPLGNTTCRKYSNTVSVVGMRSFVRLKFCGCTLRWMRPCEELTTFSQGQTKNLAKNWEFPRIRGTILGVPMIRTTVFWGLCRGPRILGNYQLWQLRAFNLGRGQKSRQVLATLAAWLDLPVGSSYA